jgi:hypothetical protein
MAYQTWETLVNSGLPSGAATGLVLENSEALTDISPGAGVAGQALTIPAGLLQVGTILRFLAAGIYSTTGTPSLTLGLYFGAVAAAKPLTSAVITTTATKNKAWQLEATARVGAAGEVAKFFTQGKILGVNAVATASASAGVTTLPLGEDSTGGESAQNTAIAQMITLGAKWSAKSAEDKITCFQWLVEILN